MKIVKNACFGGFSLSPLAIKKLAELEGKECYFFKGGLNESYVEITLEEAMKKGLSFHAFSVRNPNEVLPKDKRDSDGTFKSFNEAWDRISLDARPEDRTNLNLVKVVEELGDKANGQCARLEVVEIPDGIEYEIDEYDGSETIREKHRTW